MKEPLDKVGNYPVSITSKSQDYNNPTKNHIDLAMVNIGNEMEVLNTRVLRVRRT